jgi:hypothetical protein
MWKPAATIAGEGCQLSQGVANTSDFGLQVAVLGQMILLWETLTAVHEERNFIASSQVLNCKRNIITNQYNN